MPSYFLEKVSIQESAGGRAHRKADAGGVANYARSATNRGSARSPSETPQLFFFHYPPTKARRPMRLLKTVSMC